MKNLLAALALGLLLSANTFGQLKADKKYAIDSLYQVCLDSAKNQNTFGIITCSCNARDAWEKEIQKYITSMGTLLTPEENTQLQNSQKAWIAYRDSEILISSKVFGKLEATKWRSEVFVRQYEIIRRRALDLKSYYDALRQK